MKTVGEMLQDAWKEYFQRMKEAGLSKEEMIEMITDALYGVPELGEIMQKRTRDDWKAFVESCAKPVGFGGCL